MNVLVLAPHPDDEVLGCGGSILQHAAKGDTVAVLYMTNGGFLETEGVSLTERKNTRKQESKRCCELLGVKERFYLDATEQGIEINGQSLDFVTSVLEKYKPDLVYCPHDQECDKDHQITYKIMKQSMERLAGAIRFDIYYYEIWTPIQHFSVANDITEVFDIKLRALSQYESQLKIKRYDLCVKALNFYRAIMYECGKRYAEVFQRG